MGTKVGQYKKRYDWNSLGDLDFTKYTEEVFPKVDIFLRYLADFVEHYNLNVSFNKSVKSIGRKEDGSFVIQTECNKTYFAKKVILSKGAKEFIP